MQTNSTTNTPIWSDIARIQCTLDAIRFHAERLFNAYPADMPGLELLNTTVAHVLRGAIANHRIPTASCARLLNHLGAATKEIEAALSLAKVGAAAGPAKRRTAGSAV